MILNRMFFPFLPRTCFGRHSALLLLFFLFDLVGSKRVYWLNVVDTNETKHFWSLIPIPHAGPSNWWIRFNAWMSLACLTPIPFRYLLDSSCAHTYLGLADVDFCILEAHGYFYSISAKKNCILVANEQSQKLTSLMSFEALRNIDSLTIVHFDQLAYDVLVAW